MSIAIPDIRLPERTKSWKWWVCGLLLLATMVNYIDRLTLNLTATEIMKDFALNERGYGMLESAFGTAFAFGAIIMGWFADRWNVRWIYPAAVIAWSLAGFATGLAQGFFTLLLCRFLLGLAEAGNWPCALRTTQRILTAEERTLGNSILQSGAAVGAVLTPLFVVFLLRWTGSWRYPFMVVGLLGMFWSVFWLASVRSADLALDRRSPAPSLLGVLSWLILLFAVDIGVHLLFAPPPGQTSATNPLGWVPLAVKILTTILGIAGVFFWLWRVTGDDTALPRSVFFRRYWVLATVVVMINLTWHYLRTWLPLFLQKQHGYSLEETSWFSLVYYVSSDAGSLAAGFAVLLLARGGLAVHRSRVLVYTVCAVVTTLTLAAAVMPAGPLLLATLLVIAFATLALFPSYYSFSQELTVQHQGKLTGALGCTCWLSMALLHELAGDSVVRTGSYSQGLALAGLAPLIGLVALVFFWGKSPEKNVELPAPVMPLPMPRTESEAVRAATSGVRE